MKDNSPVIQTHDLSKIYGKVEALRNLNLLIRRHQITAFLGQNGAGKSTAIKCLLGMMRPSGARAYVLGWRSGDRAADERSCNE